MMKLHTFSATPTPAEGTTPKALTMVLDDQEGRADEQLLQGDGRAELHFHADGPAMEAHEIAREVKGQGRPPGDDRERDQHADGLAATVAMAAPAVPM